MNKRKFAFIINLYIAMVTCSTSRPRYVMRLAQSLRYSLIAVLEFIFVFTLFHGMLQGFFIIIMISAAFVNQNPSHLAPSFVKFTFFLHTVKFRQKIFILCLQYFIKNLLKISVQYDTIYWILNSVKIIMV